MLIKICGARTPRDVAHVGSSGADLVGLWYGMPCGLPSVQKVSELARATTNQLAPVLVTFLTEPDRLRDILSVTGVRWIQLHGFQQPSAIRKLKSYVPEVEVIKVLHFVDGKWAERQLLGAYDRAGVDYYLLDYMASTDRMGSTGLRLPAGDVLSIADDLNKPFLLAGGISDVVDAENLLVSTHPKFGGIDVDTAARNRRGDLSARRSAEITRSWRYMDRTHKDVGRGNGT